MIAQAGDRIVLLGTHVDDRSRIGTVLEVRNSDGTPPYLVKWLDNEHEALVFPGSDARIERRVRS